MFRGVINSNGIPIKNVDRGDYLIWLNNNNDGGDRFNNLVITSDFKTNEMYAYDMFL